MIDIRMNPARGGSIARSARSVMQSHGERRLLSEAIRSRFPGGVAVAGETLRQRARHTRKLVEQRVPAIHGPVAENAGIVVRAEALVKLHRGWRLVQASTDSPMSEEELRSAAVAWSVFRRSGTDVREVVVARLDRGATMNSAVPIDFVEATSAVKCRQADVEDYLVSLWRRLFPRPSQEMLIA